MTMREINSDRKKKPLMIKDKNKLLVTNEQEQAEIITKYFGNLFAPNKNAPIKSIFRQRHNISNETSAMKPKVSCPDTGE